MQPGRFCERSMQPTTGRSAEPIRRAGSKVLILISVKKKKKINIIFR